ncbi:Interferon regulatory factor 4, partial [Cuculus canorus]
QAWAVYKGKYHEGTDKADPSTWKTRLRCALNKSTDFQEVPERSQLDISEPYKVYQIVSDSARDAGSPCCHPSPHHSRSPPQGSEAGSPEEERQKVEMSHVSPLRLLSAHPAEQGYHVRGVFYGWNPTHGHLLPGPHSYLPVEDVNHSDCWLHIRLYYCDVLVKEVTTRTAEGCRITSDCPNKLEREKTYKLLDTQQFLHQLRGYLSHGQPAPQYQIHLCFGEEFPTSAGHHFQKLIMAHVEPVFARELFHHAQRMGPMLLRDSPQPCAPGASSHIIRVLKQLCQP